MSWLGESESESESDRHNSQEKKRRLKSYNATFRGDKNYIRKASKIFKKWITVLTTIPGRQKGLF